MDVDMSKQKLILANTCGSECPCKQQHYFTHLNIVTKPMKNGIDPPAELPPVKYINIRGREEHEAIIKDAAWCKELGLDQAYEIMVYLKRWGSWLED